MGMRGRDRHLGFERRWRRCMTNFGLGFGSFGFGGRAGWCGGKGHDRSERQRILRVLSLYFLFP